MSVEASLVRANDGLIEIRLAGEDVAPGTVRSRDLADIIGSAEDMIASVVVRDNPDLQKDEIVVGLLSIGEGSMSLQFASPLPDLVLPAYSEIADSIQKDDYENLPPDSVKSLQIMTAFSRKRNCGLELYARHPRRKPLAVITPETRIRRVPTVTGLTTIYGRVNRLGGREPKVVIELPGHALRSCDISVDMAKELGPKIYEWVGLRGTAEWSSRDLSLQKFDVENIVRFEDTPISEAIGDLSEAIGEYFEEIDDVEAYVSDLRARRAEG